MEARREAARMALAGLRTAGDGSSSSSSEVAKELSRMAMKRFMIKKAPMKTHAT